MPPPGGYAQRLPAVLHRRWRRYAREFRRLLSEGPTETAVHDYRVSARRLLSLLNLLRSVSLARGGRGLARRIKRRFDAAGQLRDVQVEALWAAAHPLAEQTLQGFRDALGQQEATLRDALRAVVSETALDREQRRFLRLAKRLARRVACPTSEAVLQDGLARQIDALATETLSGAEHVRRDDPASLHLVRIPLKKLRYALESLHALQGSPLLRNRITTLKGWQTRLGDIQDRVVLREALGRFAGDADPQAWAPVLGMLAMDIEERTAAVCRRRAALRTAVGRARAEALTAVHPALPGTA